MLLSTLHRDHQGKLSDKWALYLRECERLFQVCQDLPVRLFEIGVQNGGSLEVWARYFPRAQSIVGCDIDPNCGKLVFDDFRIKVVVGDVT